MAIPVGPDIITSTVTLLGRGKPDTCTEEMAIKRRPPLVWQSHKPRDASYHWRVGRILPLSLWRELLSATP